MNFTLLVVVLLTAIAFVGVVIAFQTLSRRGRIMHKSSKRMNVVSLRAVNHGCSFG